ncbi:hypothetical protein [Secundilactobacillus similis]|uniref:hypothetical protein n=1 Tax=Secundilactobacillus similis TaxID=414682 RepID=UPI0006CFD4AE|nr:hypothetical protein [Secundilactobacillus similis]
MEQPANDYLTLATYNAILHRQLQRDMNQLLLKDDLPVNITEMYLMVLIMESHPISQRQAATTLAVDEAHDAHGQASHQATIDQQGEFRT